MPRPVTLLLVAISLGTLAVSALGFAAVDFAMAELLIFTPALAICVILGGFVLVRQPRNLVGGLLLAFGAGGCVMYPLAALGAAPPGTPGAAVAGAIVQALDPMTYLLVSLLLLVFPDGRLPSARWRPAVPIAIAAFALSVAGNLFAPGALMVFPQHDNPLGLEHPFLLVAGAIGYVLAAATMLAAAVSLVVRWRRSTPLVRTQLKWIAASGTALAVTTAFYVLSFFVWGVALLPLVACSIAFAAFPITVAIAVLRYRLYEIDRIISRTLSYAIVTGVLAVVFVGTNLVLQALVSGATGQGTLGVAASTLAVAALFQPLRRRVQAGVDRRFNRARVDAQEAIDAFGLRVRDQVDLGDLQARLLGTVTASVHPAAASVWIRR